MDKFEKLKILITENQLKNLILKLDEKDIEKVSKKSNELKLLKVI